MIVFSSVLALMGVATDGRVRACSLAGNQPHTLNQTEQMADRVAPARPAMATVGEMTRGRGPRMMGCGGPVAASSCDNLGIVVLRVEGTDDRTPADQLGYRLTLKSGTLPPGMDLPTGAVRARPIDPARPPQLLLAWVDGATNRQEAIDFTLSIAAVDLAGNAGEPIDLRVADPGQ